MKQIIRTKLHRVKQMLEIGDAVYWTAPQGGRARLASELARETRLALAACYGNLPAFVLDEELCSARRRDEYHASALDMKRAGVLRLPFPALTAEVTMGGRHYVAELVEHEGFCAAGHLTRLDKDQDGEYLVVSPCVVSVDVTRDGREAPWVKLGYRALSRAVPAELVEQTCRKDGAYVYVILISLITSLLTQGVDTETVECERLNRKRVSSSRTPIPRHTYVHVGRVYRSAAGNETDEYVPRRSPRPHWRRGHLRHVHYGTGREKVRQVFVPPRLVALRQDDAGSPSAPRYVVTN